MHLKLTTLLLLMFSFVASPLWAADEDTPAINKAIYYAIKEPFTINFMTQSKKKERYLQIQVALMSHDQTSIDNAKANLPMIQDGLRNLFTDQTLESVSSVKGRQAIQAKALKTVNQLLTQEIGKESIEAVYFTSFILQ